MRTYRTRLIVGLFLGLAPAASTYSGSSWGTASAQRARKAAAPVAASVSPRVRTLFDFEWRFHAGDVPDGQASGANDSAWERVDLPHDFMILGKGDRTAAAAGRPLTQAKAGEPSQPEGPFDPLSPGGAGNGYLNGGIGWYRKTFTLPAIANGRRVLLEFEGAYRNAEVWINGQKLGKRPYGYSTFEYDVTPHLRAAGTANVVAVRVAVEQPGSRWYSGAGLYRHVWLTIKNPRHIATWGTIVRTVRVTDARADLSVRLDLRNTQAQAVSAKADVVVRDASGRVVAKGRVAQAIPANGHARVDLPLSVQEPRRWSLDDPYLYDIDARVLVGTVAVDEEHVAYGIRTIEFTAEGGFILNGQHVPLQGVCLHHDLGPLGAAAFDRGIERQLEIMKQMGVNAIRTSHNPPAPALLDLADRMGFVVMDEVFDEWKENKTDFGYGLVFDEWSERDTRDMVRRDRNHASVVMWSIGNEIPEQGDTAKAEAMATRLAGFVREEDPTRYVTAAMDNPNAALKTGFAKPLDLFGVNYHIDVYKTVRGLKAYGSETSSDYSSRDQYNLVLKDGVPQIVNRLNNHVSSYDPEGPSWGNNAEVQFQGMRDAPWMAGEFVWTGFDYIGEPTPFNWPNRSSSFGIVDINGFPKDRFFLYQSQWRPEAMVHLLPHWNWPAAYAGKPIPVRVYTNADSVELFLNGASQGMRRWAGVSVHHLAWDVRYTPGMLRAVAWRGGRIAAEDRVETTSAPLRIELSADRPSVRGDGQDLAFITVRVVDANGRLVRDGANQSVSFALSGGGSIAGVDNGDPTNHEPFVGLTPGAVTHRVFNGMALVVLRAPRTSGVLTLRATAEGLAPATATIKAR
jgi:beta-galactosidase